ncbi:MAG: SDR family NAD(P)-dependent oxidoreductase [Vulcanococcus sp.]|jgi:short-subunit dehydrogenase
MPPVCLITGASSGIGAALAEAFAQRGEALLLTARRGERLEALAADLRRRHGVSVSVIPCDLAEPAGADRLLETLALRQLQVGTLVNNAGFGLRGDYTETPWPDARAMLQLMVTAPARLCHGLLPTMQAAGTGTIVNVASLAGLIPGLPGSTLYSASKAFLIRFSQSLAAETSGAGVRVLAVCPGYVHTEFHAVLGVEERMQRLPGLFWMEAADLAERVLDALAGRRPVLVPGGLNRSIAVLARLLPETAAGRLSVAFSRRYRGRP